MNKPRIRLDEGEWVASLLMKSSKEYIDKAALSRFYSIREWCHKQNKKDKKERLFVSSGILNTPKYEDQELF